MKTSLSFNGRKTFPSFDGGKTFPSFAKSADERRPRRSVWNRARARALDAKQTLP